MYTLYLFMPLSWGNMPYLPVSVTVCLLGCFLTGSALDISDVTLINPDPVVSSGDASLLCVSSDWTSSGPASLALGHEFPQMNMLSSATDATYRSATSFTWKTRSNIYGAFFCKVKSSDSAKVYTYKMLNEASFLPEALTVTASVGDNVTIMFTRKKVAEEDTIIYKEALHSYKNVVNKDPSFVHSVPRDDIADSVSYLINNVQRFHAGLYTIRYMSESPPTSAITHLIVRSCKEGLWGSDCTQPCPVCTNGGVCDDKTGECVCPPGFKGRTCETVCGEGRFGKACKEHCRDGKCRSMVFCLRDPYGCSCASGWRGLNCSEECARGYYGAGCKLKCECGENNCDRFKGCVCPGRHGARCEKEDKAPVIISNLEDIELNAGAPYTVNCSVKRQPAPLHGEIILLNPHKSIIYPMDTDTVGDQSISVFRVDRITVNDAGRWVCQVKTTSVEKTFMVTVKVPPQPQYPPSLNSSGPNYLVVLVNRDSYTGDGPVSSVSITYKQVNSSTWETVQVIGSRVKLENLYPMTQYIAYVQLSRSGPGGTGYPGPEAKFYTQKLGLKLTPLNQTSQSLSWDPAPVADLAKDDWYYEVVCEEAEGSRNPWNFKLPLNSTGIQLKDLRPRNKYKCRVCLSNRAAGHICPTVSAWTLSDVIPPPPFNVSTSNITDSSANLSWSIDEGYSISKVIIHYQQAEEAVYSQQVDLGVQPSQNSMHFMLRGLRADTKYLLELWTVNNMGQSEMKEHVPLKTLTPQENSRLFGFRADGNMLFFAILGSAGMTCLTILLAFCIVLQLKRASFQRRMVCVCEIRKLREEPVVQFTSGSLNGQKKVANSTQAVSYPMLEWSDIKFQDVIGEGNFGQVLKARIKKDGLRMDAAIKRMKEYASKDDHRDFAGELEVLCKLGNHPNIINLLGACEHRGYLYLAIEYAPHGNLLDFLRKSRVLETDPAFAIANSTASTLSSQQLLHFAADVARGMDYLSQKQFIHRDLAARNILVGENFTAKIADFGLSRGQEVYVKKTMGRLPVRWMAIESLNYSVYTTNSDVWSYGVLLWEVVSLGGTPYCGMTCAELYEKLPQGYRLEKPLNCDDEVYELMRQCWREKPYERPSFAQILVSLNRMLEERKTYVNTTLYEKFTYAGIDCSAEEAG
ncbi:angiopoietin-1 receptor isoform 2-T2 [Clarias gariepinus]